jgi:hypothetical protein
METKIIEKEIQQNAKNYLEATLEGLFSYFHSYYKTESGDIAPDQQAELDELTEKLANLIGTQIYQNI